MKRFFAVVLFATLAACAATPTNPQQAVFQASQDYVAAAKGANIYLALPRCSSTQAAPCSSPDIVAKVKIADSGAYTALTEAQKVVRAPTGDQTHMQVAVQMASGAISTLTAVLKTLGVSP